MGCGSSTEGNGGGSSNGHGAVRTSGNNSRDSDAGFISPPPPAAYEEPDPKPRPPQRYISRMDEDDEDCNPNAPAEVTNKQNDMRTQHMGRVTSNLETRSSAKSKSASSRPSVRSGELWRDKFTDVALRGASVKSSIEWKRPSEIADDPCLYSEGTTRFDIGQGSAGTCWFLSILASLADKPDIIHQVIPEGSYRLGESDYDGVFHCRFWQFGDWVDVFVDDLIPVPSGSNTPWGARSSTDPNEMWVTLMEKAFAKFQGSYRGAWGGWPGDAFICLTGGVAERVDMDDHTPKELYQRVKNALASGSVLSCSVPLDKDGYNGLVGGHAYTLTGAAKELLTDFELMDGMAISANGKACPLFRIRNPWGKEKGEWTGPWGDDTKEWSAVSDAIKDKIQVQGRGDGEFWMSLKDYCQTFRDTHICNFTPDFDKDGTTDGLDQACCILGEWKGRTAAGSDENKLENQKFVFTIPSKGMDSDGKTPVVVQFMQHKDDRNDDDLFYIRADLLQIESEIKSDRHYMVLNELTNYKSYYKGPDVSYRYSLEPGTYMLLPTTRDPKQEKDFCIRIFSEIAIQPSELKETPATFHRHIDLKFNHNGQKCQTSKITHHFGMWKKDVNAGGQISNKTFHTNPQYLVSVSGKSARALTISLKQEYCKPKVAIGFKVYKIADRSEPPLDLRYLYTHHNDRIRKDIAGDSTFVSSYYGEAHYILDPGHYIIIVFTDKANSEKHYVLSLASEKGVNMSFKEYNTVTE